MRILLVEDELPLNQMLADILEANGFDVDVAYDGETGLSYFMLNAYDAVLLDRLLPKMDGIELLKRVREHRFNTPVLMITAMDAVGDQVYGLDAGADDYLPKPFSTDLLLARLRALLRRPADAVDQTKLQFDDIELLMDNRVLKGPAGEVELSAREFDLLAVLMKNADHALPRETLLMRVWGPGSDVGDGNLGNYILLVRKSLGKVGSRVKIETLRGLGYRLEAHSP